MFVFIRAVWYNFHKCTRTCALRSNYLSFFFFDGGHTTLLPSDLIKWHKSLVSSRTPQHQRPRVWFHTGEGGGAPPLLGFTPFWCAVTKGTVHAPLDRSLVTLMAQGSLIETIGVKRTLEITNIRSQLSCWCADIDWLKKKGRMGVGGGELQNFSKKKDKKENSLHIWSSEL